MYNDTVENLPCDFVLVFYAGSVLVCKFIHAHVCFSTNMYSGLCGFELIYGS